MKKSTIILLVVFLAVGLNSCKKTYEEGPAISLRSKFSRITGKWKLVSMEGVPRLHPEVDQYMELTKEKIDGEKYKAVFTNFQEAFCSYDTISCDSLFNEVGYWCFFNGIWGDGEEVLSDKEGLKLVIIDEPDKSAQTAWKILELTNKKLVIISPISYYACYYHTQRTLTFEKE